MSSSHLICGLPRSLFLNHGLQFSICAFHLSSTCLALCPAFCHFSLVAPSLASVTLVLALIHVLLFLSFNVICSNLHSVALCVLINLSINKILFKISLGWYSSLSHNLLQCLSNGGILYTWSIYLIDKNLATSTTDLTTLLYATCREVLLVAPIERGVT